MKWILAFVAGLIAAPLLFAIAGVTGLLGSNATSVPPRWENRIFGGILESSLERRAKGVANPIKADDKAALADGKELYTDNCAGCHGDAQASSKWGSHGFYPRVPQFFQQGESDLTPEEAFAAIHDGIRYSGMGAWKGMMSDSDMWKVANFVASIRSPSSKAMPKPAQ